MYERQQGVIEPEHDPTGRRVEGKVKWFNATKGFGFVTMSDGTQDAFLPMAILRRSGYDDVREGASITCEVGAGAKGPLVVSILAIDNTTALDAGDPRGRPAMAMEGAVKWFEPDKGYGFISPDGGGKDIFIHVTALRRSGLAALEPGQRVRVDVIEGRKGLEAERITIV